jgi:NAD(P)H-hydrate epimerase
MASGGMGDVLAGILGGLLAQGLSTAGASRLGTYLHGAVADHVAAEQGEIGLLASDLIGGLPAALRRLAASGAAVAQEKQRSRKRKR